MADNFKTYTQAVTDGDIFVWAAGGDKLAKKERFDQNTKFVMDNQTELWTKVHDAMVLNAGVTGELNAEVAAQIVELQKITANAPVALDTLKEIADSLGNDTDFATTVVNQLALKANKIVDHDLVPDAANIRNLGSPDKPFKDLYLSNASLYIDGQQVMSSSGDTINVSADEDQNVRITTAGVGDIEIYPKGTGTIELKGTVEVTAGKLVRTSDGSPLLIDGPIDIDGNLVADNLTAVKINNANINTLISDVNNLKVLVQSDESTLDTLQEVVDFIQLNRSTLESLGISSISGLQSALTTLQANINAEATARATAVTGATDSLTIALNLEKDTRAAETAANLVKINQEVTARTNDVTTLTQNLTNAISNLTTLINTEASTRASADSTLTTNLQTEGATRLSNDNAIIARIEPLEAEYNFGKVTVGSTTLTADAKTDTLTLVAGTNITLSADSTTDTVTISANDTSVDWSEIQNKPDPVITLAGDLTGSVTLTDLASGTLTATIAANSVALGTDTTGDYVAGNTAGTGIAVTGTAGEGWSPTISLATVGTAGTYPKVTTDAYGRVTAGTTLSASDIPSLDASKITSGTIDAARLPSYVDDVIEGTNLAAFPATGETGKIYVALDTNKTYRWSGSAYVYITSGAVDSVAGKTGVVTLVKGDVGLGSVDNTSDASKPISTLTQSALDLKAPITSPTFTGTVSGITKAMVGLGSVDNTADSAKSVLSATKLTTARTINGVSFDGTANITVADSTKQPLDADLTAIAGLTGTSGLLKKTAADTWTLDTNAYITGNQSISVSGDASGSGTTSISLTLANSGVTAGTYTKTTVDAKGRVTSGTTLSSADLPTYTGTITSSQVTTGLGFTPYNSTNPSGYITSSGSISGNATTATTATNIAGGSLGTIPYQSAAGTTAQLAVGTSGYFLKSNGAAAPSWVSPAELISLDNLNNVTITSATSGQALTYNGTSWVNSTISAGATVSDDTTTNATYYPTFATATSGTLSTAKVASTKLTFNPSTGLLSTTSLTELSDANLKDNIETLEATIIDSIRPVSFNWKEDGRKAYGVIAQELEEIIPEAVFTDADGKKSVQYTQIIPFLVAEIQAMKQEINKLKGVN